MSLTAGTRLGPYEVVSAIGAGGMGEVYRAKDTNLNRDVAIKVLPESFALDADRVARFKREAQVLASLNHPNIAAIYGIEMPEKTSGVFSAGRGPEKTPDVFSALVMELVEGEDLSAHIGRGALPLSEALPIAKQIADALEAAHEQGIVHRDLKPANIKVRPDGTVKVLDFGLAKAMDSGTSGPQDPLNSPTMTARMTQMGMIIGTAAYMSPEQAAGKPVDKRSDIWAFGVVLLEMLTGKRTFDGETVSHVLASVLKDAPDFSRLPGDTPASIRMLLRRCLEKDRKKRLDSAAAARIEIDDALSGASAAPVVAASSHIGAVAPLWRRALPLAGAALAGAVLFAAVGNQFAWGQAPATSGNGALVSRLSIEGVGDPSEIAISPDGARILIRKGNALELRSMSDFNIVPLKVQAPGLNNIMFSPDGESIGFTSGLTLKRTTLSGAAAVDLAQLPAEATGCDWVGDHVYCAVGSKGIVRVPSVSGAVEQVITLVPGEYAGTPALLPDGTAVLFTLASGTQRGDWTRASVVAQSLSTGTRTVIAAAGSDPHYVSTGHVVYAAEGVWFAVRFDAKTLRTTGAPVAVIEGVGRWNQGGLLQPRAQAAISATGTLVYKDGPIVLRGDKELIVSDRNGQVRVLPLDSAEYESPRLSPDGMSLAVSTNTAQDAAVWIYDLSAARAIRRLTFTGRNRLPVWSPDSKRVAFQSDRGGDVAIYVQPVDGSGDAERLTTAPAGTLQIPESWSLDGRYLSFSSVSGAGGELWLLSMGDRTSARFGNAESNAPVNSSFSPDGRWIAYTLRGRREGIGTAVFVQPVPATGATYQLSDNTSAGHHPFWSRNGSELFYWGQGGGTLVSTPMSADGRMTPGRPTAVPGRHPSNMNAVGPLNYDISPDGREFVYTRRTAAAIAAAATSDSIKVVLNWLDELKRAASR